MTLPVRPVVRKPCIRFPALGRARAGLARAAARLGRPAPPIVRWLLAAATLAGLVALIVFSLLRLGAGIELRAMEQDRGDSNTGNLDASSIAQSFRSPRANLSSVQVLLSAFNGPPEDGRVRLLTGDGLDGKPVY